MESVHVYEDSLLKRQQSFRIKQKNTLTTLKSRDVDSSCSIDKKEVSKEQPSRPLYHKQTNNQKPDKLKLVQNNSVSFVADYLSFPSQDSFKKIEDIKSARKDLLTSIKRNFSLTNTRLDQ